MQPPRPVTYAPIPPRPSHDFADVFTAGKLAIAAGLVVVAAVLGIALTDQASNMASASTLTAARSGIVVGHS